MLLFYYFSSLVFCDLFSSCGSIFERPKIKMLPLNFSQTTLYYFIKFFQSTVISMAIEVGNIFVWVFVIWTKSFAKWPRVGMFELQQRMLLVFTLRGPGGKTNRTELLVLQQHALCFLFVTVRCQVVRHFFASD